MSSADASVRFEPSWSFLPTKSQMFGRSAVKTFARSPRNFRREAMMRAGADPSRAFQPSVSLKSTSPTSFRPASPLRLRDGVVVVRVLFFATGLGAGFAFAGLPGLRVVVLRAGVVFFAAVRFAGAFVVLPPFMTA